MVCLQLIGSATAEVTVTSGVELVQRVNGSLTMTFVSDIATNAAGLNAMYSLGKAMPPFSSNCTKSCESSRDDNFPSRHINVLAVAI